MTTGAIELRLPPEPQHAPVLRAVVGVIAGAMSFNYDEIVQLRTAVSEAFDLAIKYPTAGEPNYRAEQISIRFTVDSGNLEIVIQSPEGYRNHVDAAEEAESRAFLESLVDELDLGGKGDGMALVRMVKYGPSGKA